MTSLFEPFSLPHLVLKNRIVMAPMTRARRVDLVPDQETAEYYGQRASAGLIISEGTPVSVEGQGYIDVPGIWSQEQVQGWRLVTDAVHAAGGSMFAQIWHVGRVSHTSLQPDGKAPVSSVSKPARDPKGKTYIYLENGDRGFGDPSDPRALQTDELPRIVEDFAKAGRNAVDAGFDGIEIHSANGYLFEQFFNPVLNDREDAYGGSLENRTRLLLETVDALAKEIGAHRVGVRLAPFNRQHDMPAYDAAETYLHLAAELSKRNVAFIHLNDNFSTGVSVITEEFLAQFRKAYHGAIILAGGMNKERAERLVNEGLIDLPAFGQPFISNPDLVERLKNNYPLAKPDRDTYYGGGAKGYTDYPLYNAAS